MNREDAKWLLDEYMKVDAGLVVIARELSTRLPPGEARDFRIHVGRIVSEVSHAVERILVDHPDLRPEGMDK